jgi:hypothetical protein
MSFFQWFKITIQRFKLCTSPTKNKKHALRETKKDLDILILCMEREWEMFAHLPKMSIPIPTNRSRRESSL